MGCPCCPLHWDPCAHSTPVDAGGERLSLVGLGGPTVSGWLRAGVPSLGARLDAPSLMAQVIALIPGEGGSVVRRLLPVKKWKVQRAVK